MEKIAIIGISCLLPGAENPEQYWQNLMAQKDLTSRATRSQMGVDANIFYEPEKGKTDDKYYCLRGGYIRDFQFDPNGYDIPVEDLIKLDEIYQWSLYVAKAALQDSGYLRDKSVLEKCGAILGNLSFPTRLSHHLFAPSYHKILEKSIKDLLQQEQFRLHSQVTDAFPGGSQGTRGFPWNGMIAGYPAAIIAKGLSLGGINFSLDAACASSLYSVKLARDYLLSGKADLMLAGAVSCADPFFINMGFSIFQAYPENEMTRPLDKSSSGLVAGEGAAMVVMKRYNEAVRDGDRIYAAITGVGLSNDGKGKFVLNPNPKGQILAFERAYADGGIDPNCIDYVECHATGTPIGDITEINSMAAFFGKHKAAPPIGSVKSNLGHLLTAAGMASLIKVILSMNKGVIPATIKLSDPLSDRALDSPTSWPENQPPLRAGVSAFGFGGCNAHAIVESPSEVSTGLPTPTRRSPDKEMAIVGMDALFGSCEDLDAFDRTIYEGRQHFIPLPPQRWQGIESSGPEGAYIKEFALDFLRFKIPPREEDRLIPQQLLMLKVADKAIKDAGLAAGGNVAVLVAMETELALHQYRGRVDLSWQIKHSLESSGIVLPPEKIAELETIAKDSLHPKAKPNQYTSYIGNIMASRISALWDFSGPAFTISAEENSAFKALEVAQLLLGNGEVDAVVVGAVDLAGGFENVLLRSSMAPLNQGVKTLSYDEHANGWLVGEGAGAVVLQLSETAKQQQSKIYAVIDGMSCVQANSGQISIAEAIAQAAAGAFETAGIKSTDIGYLEVFGSGVAMVGEKSEDEVEIQGLLSAYQSEPFRKNRQLSCCLGSVKANIGHTYGASGMASLIKTALCLYHRYIPGTPGWSGPKNPEQWRSSPFYVATESKTWFIEPDGKRIAAINGLAIDGSCCHLILSEATNKTVSPVTRKTGEFYLFPLTGDSRPELLAQLQQLETSLADGQNLLSAATQTGIEFQSTTQKTYTLALLGRDRDQLLGEITAARSGINQAFEGVPRQSRGNEGEWKTPSGSYFTANPLGKRGKVAFVYPGMGSSDIGLGRDIFRLFPQVYDRLETIAADVGRVMHEQKIYPRSLRRLDKKARAEKQTEFFSDGVAMCLTGIGFATAYTLMLREVFQVQPQVAFGYSLGEASGMLFALGVWNEHHHYYAPTATDALALSPLFKTQLCGPCQAGREFWGLPEISKSGEEKFWSSYLINGPVGEVRELIKQENKVYITFINSPQEVVIAGDTASCLRVIDILKYPYFPIGFDSVLHCEVTRAQYEALVQIHAMPVQKVPDIQLYSSLDLQPMKIDSNYLARNSAKICCETVDFPRLVQQVYQDGVRIFIEVGLKNNCGLWIDKILPDAEHLATSVNAKAVPESLSCLRLLAKLVSHGVSVDLSPVLPATSLPSVTGRQDKGIIKQVTLGGREIYDSIVNAENRKRFQSSTADKGPEPSQNIMTTENAIAPDQMMKIMQLQIASSEGSGTLQLLKQKNQDSPSMGQKPPSTPTNQGKKAANIIWDEADLLEFAEGKISRVFGKDYDIIDLYTRRVRLPTPPYLLVSRVTKLEAQTGKFKPSAITTEYDIPENAWYSLDGQVPWAITVESGQCDLLLISYLGIDFENKGDLVYRLLDCTLTFLDELPKEGDTLRYDIKINSFVRSGSNLLFFFSYECFVGEKMVLKMDGGCAGFFSDEQLEQGKGVILSDKELAERRQAQKQDFEPFLVCQKSSFDESDMLQLTEGNLAACFGEHYEQYGLNASLRLPPKAILMIDQVPTVEPAGGTWGLGLIIGEKILDPEHWYFPCHFKDDQVMAGSLMAEGCGQLLQFYLLYLGLQTCTTDARFQPIPNLPQVVRCRGQVTPISGKLIYRMEITEIGLKPHAYAKCNVEILLNGKKVVYFQDLGLQLLEKNPAHRVVKYQEEPRLRQPRKPALLDEDKIKEFCLGSVSKCFGPEYEIYDSGGLNASRMPNTHLNLVHRVLEVKGKRHELKKGSTIITEYDVPPDPWYGRQNSSPTLPYSILMELALQPCGFLSAYLGTTFLYPDRDLSFRNLDGNGRLIKDLDMEYFRNGDKTIGNTARLLSSLNVEGVIIQSFDFELSCDGEPFYQGWASFGFFSTQALANQVGLDRGKYVRPWLETENLAGLPQTKIDLRTPASRDKFYRGNAGRSHYRLASHQLDLLHEVTIVEGAGSYQQGYIYGRKEVMPNDWYFKCHFYLDPVMPGSLGIEAILQAMQVYALQQDLGKQFKSPRFVQLTGHEIVWKYRGQIPHGQTQMYLEIHISKVEVSPNQVTVLADASLWKPNLRIYEVKNAAIALVESQTDVSGTVTVSPPSKIELYQAPPCWGLPSLSPFCIKLQTYFRMAKVPYQIGTDLALKDAPKKKVPFIRYNGKLLGDSNAIVEYLKQELGIDLDAGLTKEERAVSLALRRTIEENLFWVSLYSRSGIESNWQYYKQALGKLLFGDLPEAKRAERLEHIKQGWYQKMEGHGIGVHTASEIFAIGNSDLSALSDYLGAKPYMMGPKATSIDAVAYSFLAYIIDVPFPSTLQEHAIALGNLKPYCDRIRSEFYSQAETQAWYSELS